MPERERLRELALAAPAKLLAHPVKSGAVEAAIQIAVRLFGLDPAEEPEPMRLNAQERRRGSALRRDQAHVAALEHERGG